MGFMDAVKSVYGNYANFNDRSRRSEYWWFFLFTFIMGVVLSMLDAMIGSSPILYGLFALGSFIPSIALAVRRLHDTGKSGWFLLLVLIPLIGPLVLLFFYVQPSGEPNKFGDAPLGGGAAPAAEGAE